MHLREALSAKACVTVTTFQQHVKQYYVSTGTEHRKRDKTAMCGRILSAESASAVERLTNSIMSHSLTLLAHRNWQAANRIAPNAAIVPAGAIAEKATWPEASSSAPTSKSGPRKPVLLLARLIWSVSDRMAWIAKPC